MSGPRVGSLCSGYEGLGMAMGVRPTWVADIDPAASALLALRYPDVPNLGDITRVSWARVPRVDWLLAGYPCQPFSSAGLRKGTDDERHLWPAVANAIGVLRPGRVLLENVANHLRLGFDVVLADLAALGYDARWGLVRASDAGAAHRRTRLFVVASDTTRGGRDEGRPEPARIEGRPADAVGGAPAADDDGGLERVWRELPGEQDPDGRGRSDTAWGAYEPAIRRWERIVGRAAPRPVEPGPNGERLSPRFNEWHMGLPAGWVTDVPGLSYAEQLQLIGNGVVPQAAGLALSLLDAA